MRYQILRSVRDKKIHVIFRDGNVPDDIRKLGPWQSLMRGDLDRLKTHYRLQLAEQGFVVVHQSMGTFPPTIPDGRILARTPRRQGRRARIARFLAPAAAEPQTLDGRDLEPALFLQPTEWMAAELLNSALCARTSTQNP